MTENQFQPDWICPPGATVSDVLEQRGMSRDQLAELLGWSRERASNLIDGKAAVTTAVANALAQAVGGSSSFWLSREGQYRDEIARLQSMGSVKAAKAWLNEFPLADMRKLGWLPTGTTTEQKLSTCLEFFGVEDVLSWRKKYHDLMSAVAFRTSTTFESEPGAVLAWLRYAEIKSAEISCRTWKPEAFEASLTKIRQLTRLKPSQFLPELTRYCAEGGVALVIARAPTGCRASGATRFLSRKKAMILLSFRYLSDDQFWFSFFHEAGHLLLHTPKATFIEDDSEVTSKEEVEANTFAQDTLLSPKLRDELSGIKPSKQSILRFAVRAGVSRGIVVGQLQHMRRIEHSQFNWLKRRFNWNEIDGSLSTE